MRNWVSGGVAVAALLAAGQAGAQVAGAPTQAQEAANAPPAQSPAADKSTADASPADVADAAPAEIIVTAQKRAERLQDVPVAVTVVSGAALAAQGRVNLEGAVNLIPSFNFLKSGTTLNQTLFLRGVGTATFSIAGEPSVSTVVDGVVFARSGEAFSELVDVDRIEVLRGPQGTLFGKNASAGVINIVSQRPTKDFGGYLEGNYFTGGSQYLLRGAINLPLGENIRTRLNGFYTHYDGNLRNLAYGGARVNGFKRYGGRLAIDADISSSVRLSLNADYHKNNDNCCAEVIATGTPVVANGALTGFSTTNPVFTVLPTPQGDKTRQVNQDLITSTIEEGWGVSAQLDATPMEGGPTVTSITAYRKYNNTEIRDGDFLPRAYVGSNQLHDFGPQRSDTFSQELRLTSPGHQFLDYVLGAYYSRAYSERVFTRNDAVCGAAPGVSTATALIPCGSGPALTTATTTPSGTADFGSVFKNLALFGQATANLTRAVRLVGGVRYTADQLDVFHSRVSTGLGTANNANTGFVTVPAAAPGINPNFDQGVNDRYYALIAAGVPAAVAGAQAPLASNGVPFRAKTTSTNWSGRAGVQFDIDRRVMLYGTYARGYKGPAFNIFYNLTATGTNTIAPETSDAFEVGLKNTLLGGRLVLNLAGYYAKYHNFQANNPDVVAGVVVTRFTNAGEVSTRGGEVDLIFRPARDLSISGGAAYTDAHVDRFNAAPNAPASAIIPAGTPLGFAPKFKGNIGADYRLRTGGALDFFGGAQGSYQSSQLALFAPDPVQRQLGTIHSYGLINLSAGIVTPDDRIRITGQVRNLLNQSFAAAITNGGPAGSYRYQIPRDADRYYGVTARVTF